MDMKDMTRNCAVKRSHESSSLRYSVLYFMKRNELINDLHRDEQRQWSI